MNKKKATYIHKSRSEKKDKPSAVDDAADVMSKFVSKPEFTALGKKPFKELKAISQLSHNHPAKIYISGRKIPSSLYNLGENFSTIISTN